MHTYHVYFPVRDDHEHRGEQVREKIYECSNIVRLLSQTRIHTLEKPADEDKHVDQ